MTRQVLISEFGSRSRVIVDRDAREVTFERCHVRRWSLGLTQPIYRCSLDDIRDMVELRYKRHTHLRVATPDGKAYISKKATNYAELTAAFAEQLAAMPAVPSLESTFDRVCLYGALAGILLGWPVATRIDSNSDGILAVCMLVGAVAGIGVAMGIVKLLERLPR